MGAKLFTAELPLRNTEGGSMNDPNKSVGIGHNRNKPIEDAFEKAYKKLRVVCQIVHNRLEFLRDNLNKARNAESETDRIEGLLEARGEINFIQTHTGPLQASYHGFTGNEKGDLIPADDADVSLIEEKHGKDIADAEKLIMELKEARDKADAIAKATRLREDKGQHD